MRFKYKIDITMSHEIDNTMTQSDEYDILDEYVDITIKIREIQGIINRYRNTAKRDLRKARTEREQNKIIETFKENIDRIKQNDAITKTYKKLRKRQSEIRNILLGGVAKQDRSTNSRNDTIESDSSSDKYDSLFKNIEKEVFT